LLDPCEGEGVEDRIRSLGEPAGVIVLLDRHRRDADALAERLAVPVHETPFDGIPGTPFELRPIVRRRRWREVALWWPARRVFVAADALGTIGYMRAGEEPLGVHPFLRLVPPRRTLAGLDPEHVLVGHGDGVHGAEAGAAFRDALAASRRRIPALAAGGVRSLVGRIRS
jgi:hypothetical protein